MNKSESAIIIGTYINAYSIYKCLKKVGFSGNIYAVDVQMEKKKTFIETLAKDIKVIKVKLQTIDDVVNFIDKIVSKRKYMFFTDEECIDVVKAAVQSGRVKDLVAYTGSDLDNKFIFNRYEFYRFIEYNNLALVPKTISSDENPFEILGDKFIIRPKNSWEGDIKTPRLSIVENQEELYKIENEYLALGMKKSMWCYQELLSSVDQHNLSVCGWYEETGKLFSVTRKVIQHPPKTGCGDVIEIVKEYPSILLEYTEKVLSALKYRGPFELEFVYDINTQRYCVIELNPRYWMQHELMEKNSDYFLIRKNLNQTCTPCVNEKYRYWINTNQFMYRLVKGQIGLVRYLKHAVKVPGVFKTLKWTKYYFRIKE